MTVLYDPVDPNHRDSKRNFYGCRAKTVEMRLKSEYPASNQLMSCIEFGCVMTVDNRQALPNLTANYAAWHRQTNWYKKILQVLGVEADPLFFKYNRTLCYFVLTSWGLVQHIEAAYVRTASILRETLDICFIPAVCHIQDYTAAHQTEIKC